MLKYENMTDHVINSWKLPPYHLMGKPFNLKHLNGKKKFGPNLMQKAWERGVEQGLVKKDGNIKVAKVII